jgi:uncharacterized MAPEG superfamily protein
MTTPFACVLIAFLLIWAARIPVFVALGKHEGGFDNSHPHRQLVQLARREGFGARAVGAYRGLGEAFAPFAAGVVIADLAGADPRRSSVLAIAFVVCEVVYVAAYLANIDYLRAFVWLIGFLATIGLFALAATA